MIPIIASIFQHSTLTKATRWMPIALLLSKYSESFHVMTTPIRPNWKVAIKAPNSISCKLKPIDKWKNSQPQNRFNIRRINRDYSRSYSATTALQCQLLGLNCGMETEFSLTRTSWDEFCQRGGKTDIHSDGWGLAYYVDNEIRQFRDVQAAATSPLARFIGSQPIQTRNFLAHIRYATSGGINMANVHPFSREIWGLNLCFCHNGHVPLFEDHPNYALSLSSHMTSTKQERYFHPVGSTDSEATFCAILNALRSEFSTEMPPLPLLTEKIQSLCQEIVSYNPNETILNFILSIGPHTMFVYSWPGRRPGSKVWNGLHYTVRNNLSSTGYQKRKTISQLTKDRQYSKNTCIVATKPLTTNEEWIEVKSGELIVVKKGTPYASPADLLRNEFLT